MEIKTNSPLVITSALLAFLLTSAGHISPAQAEHRPASLSQDDIQIIQSSFFAGAHPDLRWRLSALENIRQGNDSFVMEELLRAARYGDKPSQAMVAEAYWKGLYKEKVDRPLAYAWMDLAAERGYKPLLVKREVYWSKLSAAEQDEAIERGAEVYAEYGDDVALPRLDEKLRRARSEKTGSRLGSNAVAPGVITPGASKVKISVSTPISALVDPNIGSLGSMHANVSSGANRSKTWESKFWDLDRYIAWKAVALDAEFSGLGDGEVEVLPIKAVPKSD